MWKTNNHISGVVVRTIRSYVGGHGFDSHGLPTFNQVFTCAVTACHISRLVPYGWLICHISGSGSLMWLICHIKAIMGPLWVTRIRHISTSGSHMGDTYATWAVVGHPCGTRIYKKILISNNFYLKIIFFAYTIFWKQFIHTNANIIKNRCNMLD